MDKPLKEETLLTPERKAFWNGRRVFVTGGFGLLGSQLVDFLVRCGAQVVALRRDFTPHSRLLTLDSYQKVTVIPGDIEDANLMMRVLSDYEVETIFHVAAQPIAPIANRFPVPTLKTNIMGTINVLEAARLSPWLKRMVIASSDKAYGDQPVLPYEENAPLEGRHPYDVSKSCADLIAQAYRKTYGLPVCITRCGNLYGPGDLNFSRIVPGTVEWTLRGETPIIRSDGKAVRDYFFVKDAALGYMTIAENMDREDVAGEPFNLSTGNGMSALTIMKKVLSTMGSDVEPIVKNEAKAEIQDQTLSSEKALKVLGWKPLYTIEEGLEETIAWYKEYFAHKAEMDAAGIATPSQNATHDQPFPNKA